MHIVALVESQDHVCCRYRIAAFRPPLEAAGHRLTISPLPRGILARWQLLRTVQRADVVILQRKLLSKPELLLLRQFARKLIFDFDDAIWLRDSYSPKGFVSRKRANRFRSMMRAADVVVAGNRLLADEARIHTTRARVVVIPTCVDTARYPVKLPFSAAERGQGGELLGSSPVTLVWVGSSSTLQGLERNRDTFEAIGKAVPNVRLRIVCDRFPTFTNLPIDPIPWSEAIEADAIASADIGVGWVPDDPWSRGKCGLKLLQYQAAGLPVIANAVGVQADIVRHGENGIIANTTEEWVAAVRHLAADPDERKRFSRAGRMQVESAYSVDCGGRAWVELLAGLADRTGVSEGRP